MTEGSEPEAVAVGAFDGVHAAHARLLAAAGSVPVVSWDPEPGEQLLCTLPRRLELLEEAGAAGVLFLPRSHGSPLPWPNARVLVDPDEEDRSLQDAIRAALDGGDVRAAARLLGRPPEVEGHVVGGDARGRTLGFPTANLNVDEAVLVPALGIYAGWAAGTRAAVSIGTNPTYGGVERRVEAFLLDFDGDLYGQRLVVELWERLRDEAAFASEQELVDQIADDVTRTRAATRPDVSVG